MKISFMIILYILISCTDTNKMLYTNSYNYLLENKVSQIRQFAEEESNSDLDEQVSVIVSNEIVHLEAVFFESKSEELAHWKVFEGKRSIKDFLWNLDTESSFDSFISDNEIVKTKSENSNLILFFSKMNQNLLVAELIWTPEQVNSNTEYEEVAMFGRSLRFLFEISDSNEVINVINMEIHHN